MDNWYMNAIFYEINPRAFMDGNDDGIGDFAGLRHKLDYLQWLGIDCIWLLPIYPSPLRDDGYDISEFCGLHEDFGENREADFKQLVADVHQRGMKIIADLVLNHTSDQHPWFREARQSKDSPKRDYYVWSKTGAEYPEARVIFYDTEGSNWAWDETSGEYYWHRFFSHQPDLNYDNPAVGAAMKEVISYWLELGVDGFRADAVPYLFEREHTNCENLPETHQYLQELRGFIDKRYPGKILLAEANQWPHDSLPYLGQGEKFHMCFFFPLMPRLYIALARQDRSSVVGILSDTLDIPDTCQWVTFLRNHDELTLEMVTPEERRFMWDYFASDHRYRINDGIRRRLAPLMNNDRRKIELMNSLLFTLPGTPVIYYGDEIGMGDRVIEVDPSDKSDDRNGVRTPMQWDAGKNAGFSRADADQLFRPVIDDFVYGYQRVNIAAQRADQTSLLHTMRHMIRTRKEHPVLAKGKLRWRHDLPRHALCYWRQSDDQEMLLLHNLSDTERLRVDLSGRYTDALAGDGKTVENSVSLRPYQYRWLVAK